VAGRVRTSWTISGKIFARSRFSSSVKMRTSWAILWITILIPSYLVWNCDLFASPDNVLLPKRPEGIEVKRTLQRV